MLNKLKFNSIGIIITVFTSFKNKSIICKEKKLSQNEEPSLEQLKNINSK